METEKLVLGILKESRISLTAEEVSCSAGIGAAACLKILSRLEAGGLVEKREIKGVVLYTTKGRGRGLF